MINRYSAGAKGEENHKLNSERIIIVSVQSKARQKYQNEKGPEKKWLLISKFALNAMQCNKEKKTSKANESLVQKRNNVSVEHGKNTVKCVFFQSFSLFILPHCGFSLHSALEASFSLVSLPSCVVITWVSAGLNERREKIQSGNNHRRTDQQDNKS